jgi:BRCT domain type II-containing protein
MKKNKRRVIDENQEVPFDILDGYTIVLTGVMVLLAREKLESWIMEHGGRYTSAISGKTNMLITGVKLEDGREVT